MSDIGLEEVRGIQLRLLLAFDSLCEREGLTYFLYAGTLLGAIRHSGYIPWDDDIDVAMPRAQFERLASVGEFQAQAGGYRLLLPGRSPGYLYPFAKFHDPRTVIREHGADQDFGVNIDVFPVDAWPRGGLRSALVGAGLRIGRLLIQARLHPSVLPRGVRGRLLGLVASGSQVLVPTRVLVRILTFLATRGHWDRACAGGVIVWGYAESVPIGAFASRRSVSFEGHRVPAPGAVEEVLHAMYGDFMIPPPPLDRVSHHVWDARWRPGSVPH